MLLDFDISILFSLILLSLTLAITWYYKSRIRIYSKFPSVNILTIILKSILMSIFPKNIPATSYLFQYIIDKCRQFQSEGICFVWAGQPHLLVLNEEALKVISFSSINKPAIYDITKEIWGTGVLNTSGNEWRKRRRILNPLFYKSMLKDKGSMMNKNARILIKQLMEHPHEESPIRYLKICAFMNIFEYLTGLEFNKEVNLAEVENFFDCAETVKHMVTRRSLQPWLYPKFMMLTFAEGRRYLKRLQEGQEYIEQYFKRMKNLFFESEKEKVTGVDHKVTYVDLLKQSLMKDSTFSFQNVADEFPGLLTAGYDTITIAMMWSLFLLGHHPEEQDQLFQEVDSVLGLDDTLSNNDLQDMKYLDCVIKEVLRLYPPIPIVLRSLDKNLQYGKYTIPKDTSIIFLVYLTERDPKLYPDPEKFHPERFLEEGGRPSVFGEGQRNCLGKHFAIVELKIVLAHLIKNFKVTSLDRPEDIQLNWEIVLTTVEPLRIRLTPRSQTSVEQ